MISTQHLALNHSKAFLVRFVNPSISSEVMRDDSSQLPEESIRQSKPMHHMEFIFNFGNLKHEIGSFKLNYCIFILNKVMVHGMMGIVLV